MGPIDVNFVVRLRKLLIIYSFFVRSLPWCGKHPFKTSTLELDGRSSPKNYFQIGSQISGHLQKPPLQSPVQIPTQVHLLEIMASQEPNHLLKCSHPLEMVAKKYVGLLAEFFSSKSKTFPPTPISMPESEWINSFFFPPSPTSPLPLPSRSNWQLHEETDYLCWCNKHQSHILYFDGASKGNPGVAGVGGVIIYPRGNQVLSYHWNLGIATNNQDEAYALYQGLHLAKSRNIHSISVIGDSKIIIGYARNGSHPSNLHLRVILQRIATMLKLFPNIQFLHVLRRNNQLADLQENQAIDLEQGALVVNIISHNMPIP
jgi:ribonuclease HI